MSILKKTSGGVKLVKGMTGQNLACATSLVPRPAPKPELGTSSQIRIERCKYNAAFQSGVRLEGSPSYTRPMRPGLIFSKGIVRKVGFQSLALRG